MKELPLAGKRILFFCPKFFGYEQSICQELENLGAEVFFRSGQAQEHPWSKALLRLAPTLGWKVADRYYFEWLTTTAPDQCDIIFIVKGEAISPKFLQELRSRYDSAKVILYMFDSIKNYRGMSEKFNFIDEFYSFDPDDCKKMDFFTYRPLFFIDKYLDLTPGESGNGLFFIGTLNGDRPKVIFYLISALDSDIFFNYWLFVRSKVELFFRKLCGATLEKLESTRLIFAPMLHDEIKNHFDNCSAVLDIEHVNQTGLTMRTFEVLASGKKLVTTNHSILSHDFYDPARICLIKRDAPIIPSDFFDSIPAPLPENFVNKYSLRGWILDIFKNDITVVR